MFLCQGPFHRCRQVLFQFGCIPDGVQQERAAVFDTGQYIVFVYIRLLRARYEVGFIDQIGRRNRCLAKAQVGYGDTAGFLGVVGKVCLGIHVGVVADDLDSRLVGADRTITAEAPELAGRRTSRCRIDVLGDRQGRIGHVIGNGNGEMVFRRILFQVFENAEDMGRCRILAAEAGTAAYDERCVFYAAVGLGDIEIERFCQGALFLRAVQDGNLPDRFRDIFEEVFERERTIEMDRKEACLFSVGVEVIHRFLRRIAQGAHGDDHTVGIRRTVVGEWVIFPAGQFRYFFHVFFYDVRQGLVITVLYFLLLEVDIAVFQGAFQRRMVRGRAAVAEFLQGILVYKFCQVVVIPGFDLLDFMGCTEAVEEVEERHAAFDSRKMSNSSQVHDFLYAGFCEHGKAGLTAGHDIALVTEDRHGIGGQSTCCDVEDARQEFAGNLVHIRNHKQQALGSRISRGQGTGHERPVYSTGSAAFGLHFLDFNNLAEHVLDALGCPFIHFFCHSRARRNRINGCYIGKYIGHIGGSRVAVHGHHFLTHHKTPILKLLINVELGSSIVYPLGKFNIKVCTLHNRYRIATSMHTGYIYI